MWCMVAALGVVSIWLGITWATGVPYDVTPADMLLLFVLLALGPLCRVLRQPGLVDVMVQELTGPLDDEAR